MSDEGGSLISLTVLGGEGQLDLAVPLWTELDDVLAAYAETGATPATALRALTPAGQRLVGSSSLDELGLRSGCVIVVLPAGDAGEETGIPSGGSGDSAATARWTGPGIETIAAIAAIVAGGAAALTSGGAVRLLALGVLVLGAVLACVPGVSHRGGAVRRAAVAPAFAAAAGFAATYSSAPGRVLLSVGVGAAAAAAAAAIARSLNGSDEDDAPLVVWLIGAAIIAVCSISLLLTGGSPRGLWALLVVIAIAGMRLLPTVVVDVPDQVLLDLDRLAVTAWTARDRPRSTRRRHIVRPGPVRDIARRGQRLLSAGTRMAVATIATSGVLILVTPSHGLPMLGGWVMTGCAALGLALAARAFRATDLRWSLRAAAAVLALTLGWVLIDRYAGPGIWAGLGTVTSLALVALWAGIALGRGWRSIWWARLADVGEAMLLVLAVAIAPLAAGLFAYVRLLAS